MVDLRDSQGMVSEGATCVHICRKHIPFMGTLSAGSLSEERPLPIQEPRDQCTGHSGTAPRWRSRKGPLVEPWSCWSWADRSTLTFSSGNLGWGTAERVSVRISNDEI